MSITPMLAYTDAPAAIEFLTTAFGFTLDQRLDMPDGRVGHASLSLDGGRLMLASVYEEIGMASPANLPATHSQVQVDVADVDGHFARAKAGGATIVAEPELQPYGSRTYRAVDPEGHKWIFSQEVQADVPVEDVAKAYGGEWKT